VVAQFAVLSQGAWELLHGWYGGGPALLRPTVEEGGLGGRPSEIQLELTLLKLAVSLDGEDHEAMARATGAPLTLRISRGASVQQCLERICDAWQLDVAHCRLWDYYNKRRCAPRAGHMRP
jgi:hypothetical protein